MWWRLKSNIPAVKISTVMSTDKKPNVAQQMLASIKKLLFEDGLPPAAAPAHPAPKVYKTTDGKEISVDKLEVGGMAMISGAPAPAASYTLEDGTVLTTDATGLITTVTPVAPAAAAAPPVAPAPVAIAPAPLPAPAFSADIPDDMKTIEGIKARYEKFAVGTPEERIGNLELVAKALIEYNFGWELRQVKEAADKAAALKVYNDSLATMQGQVESQMATMKEMYTLMEQIVGLPTQDPPEQKKKFSFSNMEGKKKSFERFQEAAKKIAEQSKKAETTN
jgi:hypothetical protein